MKQSITTPRPVNIMSLGTLLEPPQPKQSLERVFHSVPFPAERKLLPLAPVLRSALMKVPQRRTSLVQLPKLPKPETLTLDEVAGSLSKLFQTSDVERVGTITITLPFGMDHYLVNAATFKALAGRERDTLLRQAGERWEIVENDEQIDLGDRTQVFKLGQVQIYS